MLSDCTERRSTITNGEQQVNVGNKKKTVISLRSLVDINLDMLPEGNCNLKSAVIRVEKDSRGRTLQRVYLKCGQYKVGWVLNGSTSKCLVCDVRFGTFRRRHHCRSCGLIMCHACSQTKALVCDLDIKHKTRICDICVSVRASVCNDSSPSDPTSPVPVVVAVVESGERDCMDTLVIDTDNGEQHRGENDDNVAPSDDDDDDDDIADDNSSVDCDCNSNDVSDVTDPHYGIHPMSTVSPSLVRKLAVLGFDGDNNSSDEDDNTPPRQSRIPQNRGHSESGDSSADVQENDSFMSASGSSLGDESAQRYFLQSSDGSSVSVSPLVCSISPIYKRQPVMRSPGSSHRGHLLPPTANLNTDLQQEKEEKEEEEEGMETDRLTTQVAVEQRRSLNRRRSIGEIFGLKPKSQPVYSMKSDEVADVKEEEPPEHLRSASSCGSSDSDGSDGYADRSASASGSSLGDASARRFFLGSDTSTCTSSASFNSLSPNGQDVVVHDTFHSPSFTSKTARVAHSSTHTRHPTSPSPTSTSTSSATNQNSKQRKKGVVGNSSDVDKENTTNRRVADRRGGLSARSNRV